MLAIPNKGMGVSGLCSYCAVGVSPVFQETMHFRKA